MPSALETLVKILKLERQKGYKNNAVIGGLAAYGENWRETAHQQARRPVHHMLVNELVDLLQAYDEIENRIDRHRAVTYMLDRIMGRVPAPPQYHIEEVEEEEIEAEPPPPPDEVVMDDVAPRPYKTQEPESPKPEPRAVVYREKRDKRQRDADDREDDLSKLVRLARPPREPRLVVAPEEASDIMRGLSAKVTTVKGVGPKIATALDKLGIYKINDMLFFLPRRYDDYTRLSYIARLEPERIVTVIGTVRHKEIRTTKKEQKYFYMELDDGTGVLNVSFFGQPFLMKQIRKRSQLAVYGKVSIFRNRLQMTNPEWEELESDNLKRGGIVPVYSLTEGLSARKLRQLMFDTVSYWSKHVLDYMPEATLDRAELGDLGWAIKNLHFPDGHDHLDHARRRYVFDQLLLLQLAILGNRRDWQSVPGQPLPVTDDFLETFIDTIFPYELTGAQRRAIEDIRRDINSDIPMNRLLQGDVGSGKTAVAITALAMAFENGKQGALMAPTSILAEQHYRGLSAAFENMPGERKPIIKLLTGALNDTDRTLIYHELERGAIDIIIGTHALIQSAVVFNDLGVAVIDEQHRFGVRQRGALRGKGSNPHILVMTATPIPRTLALTLYADLDLSIMDEMPAGRIPIHTRIVQPIERERIYGFIKAELDKGRQAFVVHPLVEESDSIDARSAVESYEELQQVFFRYQVGLLHGRMKPSEKDEVMLAFANNEFDLLVTTSVAEVGVDIPNASVIVIEGANRFGLAQLHQFRGRVGRGQHASYCLLIPDSSTLESEQRLKAMEDTTDGFKLAEIDWKLRGAGDLIGTRQSGQTRLQLMDVMTPDLVALAQREARTIYEEDPYLDQEQHHLLSQRVEMLYNESSDVS